MDIFVLFTQYGLLAIFVGVFVEQMGVPIPALPFLVLAGVASAGNAVFALEALAVATLASMMTDSLWFYAGRRFGRQVLGLLCRISISPDTCVRQSELSFARRGVATLVIAKFIPGLSILASPMAGAIGMRISSFAIFNLAGTLLWAGSGISFGLVFHDQAERLLKYLSDLGARAMPVVGGLILVYLAYRIWRRWRVARAMANVPRLDPHELSALISKGGELVILDVRATQFSQNQHVPGAQQIELADIAAFAFDQWPPEVRIITYCGCPNDASALKAAHLLIQRGRLVSVLRGGLDGWTKAGYLLEQATLMQSV